MGKIGYKQLFILVCFKEKGMPIGTPLSLSWLLGEKLCHIVKDFALVGIATPEAVLRQVPADPTTEVAEDGVTLLGFAICILSLEKFT